VWTAVADGFVRLGVLGVTLAQVDDDLRQHVADLAAMVGALLVTRGFYTDGLMMCRRSREMTLAAEMQWQLLPPLAMRGPRVSLSGLVEPAYEVGGDAFDYAINGDRLDFALFDAMGHGLQSSQLSHMAVTSYRHARRYGSDLPGMLATMDEAVTAEGDGERFVTCFLARLDLVEGRLWWMTAGHPTPMLVRGGHVIGSMRGDPVLPLGLGGPPGKVIENVLEPGDRLLAYSDGMVEAHKPGGDPFGEDRLLDLLGRETLGGLDVAETTRRLIHAVLDHHEYRLGDDATLVLVERPPPPPA
jgi:phosphoserine phosphatase RsbU/P